MMDGGDDGSYHLSWKTLEFYLFQEVIVPFDISVSLRGISNHTILFVRKRVW